MKKIILFAFLAMVTSTAFCQENLTWNVVDTVLKTKDVLYKDAKVLIANTWKSGKTVTQLDDKENGQLMIKGVLKTFITNMGMTMPGDVFYGYTMNFYFKDNKFKITLDNVVFDSETIGRGWGSFLINTPAKEYPGAKNCGMQKKDYYKLIDRLNVDLQSLVDFCVSELKKETKVDNW